MGYLLFTPLEIDVHLQIDSPVFDPQIDAD